MSRQVGPSEQGALQGSLTSLVSLCGIVGPLVSTWLFGHFTGAQAIRDIPGIAFFLGAALNIIALALAARSFARLREVDPVITPASR